MKPTSLIIIGLVALAALSGLGYISFENQAPGSFIAGLSMLWGAIKGRLFNGKVGLVERALSRLADIEKITTPENVVVQPTPGSVVVAPTTVPAVVAPHPTPTPVVVVPTPRPVSPSRPTVFVPEPSPAPTPSIPTPVVPPKAVEPPTVVVEPKPVPNLPPTPAPVAPVDETNQPPNWASFRKGKSQFVWLLDNGHGGLINGQPQTAGKRSPTFDDGQVLYEGEFNREVVRRLATECRRLEIDYEVIVPTEEDISLRKRTNMANQIKAQLGARPCILVSVHANAFVEFSESGLDFNNANGIETFYFGRGEEISTGSKRLAEVFQKHILDQTGLRDRGAKAGNFHMLRESSMPAVLTENGFMTNREEAVLLLDHGFRGKIVQAHLQAMLEIERMATT